MRAECKLKKMIIVSREGGHLMRWRGLVMRAELGVAFGNLHACSPGDPRDACSHFLATQKIAV